MNPTVARRSFSISDLRAAGACEPDDVPGARAADLRRHLGRDVAADEAIDLAVWWALPTTSVEDRYWSLRLVEGGPILAVRACCLAARRALAHCREIDRAVLVAAIESAEAYCDDPCERAAVGAAEAAEAAEAAAEAAWAAVGAAEAAAEAAGAAEARAAEIDAQRLDLDRLLADVTP